MTASPLANMAVKPYQGTRRRRHRQAQMPQQQVFMTTAFVKLMIAAPFNSYNSNGFLHGL